jgi:hypothetical protein
LAARAESKKDLWHFVNHLGLARYFDLFVTLQAKGMQQLGHRILSDLGNSVLDVQKINLLCFDLQGLEKTNLRHRSCARFYASSTKFCVTAIFFKFGGRPIYFFAIMWFIDVDGLAICLRATLKIWQQIAKPFRQMAKPSADINKPHDRLNIGNPLVKYR